LNHPQRPALRSASPQDELGTLSGDARAQPRDVARTATGQFAAPPLKEGMTLIATDGTRIASEMDFVA